jgi:CTP synthase
MTKKVIFITGGVISSLGKGISAATIGALLESRGIGVNLMKMDPYINVDPGTMNPFQHGEVFVTEDGAETDLDLGHYERYTSVRLSRENSVSAGQVYDHVINQERKGMYLGTTVQVIPHITDEIKNRIARVMGRADLTLVEVGGTVGDIESQPFLEAIRQFRADVGPEHVCFIHVSYLPYIQVAGELKTKPTQHSVKELRSIGIQPDLILCRSDRMIPEEVKKKVSLFCNVPSENVFSAPDAAHIYELPIAFHKEGIDDCIVKKLGIWTGSPQLDAWEDVVKRLKEPKNEVRIGLVGKYVHLKESYKSLTEALAHGGIGHQTKVKIEYFDSEEIEKAKDLSSVFKDVDGILVPGGFGDRGIEGKIAAIRYARESKTPFLGICFGLQLAVMEFARNVCDWAGATSREFDDASEQTIVDTMEDQKNLAQLGGTMRLGSFECKIVESSLAFKIYGKKQIQERHRHRYEVVNDKRELLESHGMQITGINPKTELVEIVEIKDHPWFLGCQFHPEFKSRPMDPHPIFKAFIEAALKNRNPR